MPDRRSPYHLGSALRPLAPLAAAWSAGATLLFFLRWQSAISTEQLVLDPNSYHRLPWYSGFVSNLGILGWGMAAMSAGFAYWACRQVGRTRAQEAFGAGALLSSLLLLDDLFQLHIVVPTYLGLPKASFYGLYGVATVVWLASNWVELSRTRWQLLSASALVFSLSLVADQLVYPSSQQLLLEDSLKFLGIVAWAQYFVLSSTDTVRSIIEQSWPYSGQIPTGELAPVVAK